jgi:hypothetical protein
MGNLDTYLGSYLSLMVEMDNLLEKIVDPMAIMVRVVGLIFGCFYFL